MNSTIFVQPSINIPAGLIADSVSNESGGSDKRKSEVNPVAAVIRPVPRELDTEGTIRFDPPNSRAHHQHLRTDELYAYVKWLKAKIEADIADSQTEPQDVQPIEDSVKPQDATETAEPAKTVDHSDTEDNSDTEDIFELEDIVELENDVELKDIVEPVETTKNTETAEHIETAERVESTELLEFVDRADGVELANFSVSDSYFSTIGDESDNEAVESNHKAIAAETEPIELQASVANLESPESSDQVPIPAPIEAVAATVERIDESHASYIESAPEAHATFTESDPSLVEAPPVDSTDIGSVPEDFITTVSKAIASVLTNQSDDEFESKIRSHFESELHARSVHTRTANAPAETNSQPMPVIADPIETVIPSSLTEPSENADQPTGDSPFLAIQTDAKKIASEILDNARREIPTTIAAWDVEDFRWPVVTNQMIVSGGEAINQLFQSTMELITSKHQRVAITGVERGIGTTSIAISLARWAAAFGKRVLLVDADIACPSLSQRVGLAPNLSWINAVNESLSASEVIVRSQKSNICIMPMATTATQVIWPRCIYDNLGELISSVQETFDLVLLDMGPGSQLLDELSRPELLVDTTLVIHDGAATAKLVKMKHRFETFGLSKFIVAQNRARRQSVNVA